MYTLEHPSSGQINRPLSLSDSLPESSLELDSLELSLDFFRRMTSVNSAGLGVASNHPNDGIPETRKSNCLVTRIRNTKGVLNELH